MGCSPWDREESDMTERLPFPALEKEMAAHSSVIAWRIPRTGEPGGLQSTFHVHASEKEMVTHSSVLA